ncbi:hypothetical protein PENSPDRAFT_693514 [Peniophora sp. CONT]|nr:hypothetical protein PENSPDRAFT_693514 [Peniophora sp. CONT]
MPHVDATNYPTDLLEGVFHNDTDDTEDYRTLYDLDHDYILWAEEDAVTHTGQWWYCMSGRATPSLLDGTFCVTMSRVPATLAAPHLNICLGTPHTFTSIANDKGVYNPVPHDFVRNTRNYIFAQEKQTGYEQEVKKAEKWEAEVVNDPTLVCTGALSNLDHFTDALLKQFEDIDIKKTAIHKIFTILQGTNSAEVHVCLFKDWASLKLALLDKVNGQDKHVPETLEGWYEDTVRFDRQWHENHLDRKGTSGNGTNNSTSRVNTQQQQPQQPRNTNQFRPWGSVAQPAQQQQQLQQPYRGPQPMDVDTLTRDPRCFECGKTDGHFASNCPTPIAEIQRCWGRDSMYTPGGRTVQNRGTNFANVGEYLNAMSQEQREELAHALQASGVQGANQTPQVPAPQGFVSGSL